MAIITWETIYIYTFLYLPKLIKDLFYINTFYNYINNKWKNPYLRQPRHKLEHATAHTISRRLNV